MVKTLKNKSKIKIALLLTFMCGLAVAQITTSLFHNELAWIKAGGLEDPLEAWSEVSYIIWKYNSTVFGGRNMSTLIVDFSGTDAATVINSVFNVNPASVFFKTGLYDLKGNTITATVPIIIEGEGRDTTLYNGTLKVQGTADPAFNWGANINVIRNLNFDSPGETVNLWFLNVTHGIIEANRIRHSSFALGVPNLLLTDSWTIRVRDNWFDGYHCQILKINGTYTTAPLHIISHNDFGSTLAGSFPALADPADIWKAAAIYIQDANNWGVNIADNLAIVHPEMIFVYSEAANTIIKNNNIVGANDTQYAIDLQAAENIVDGNIIMVANSAGGAIAARRTGNLTLVMLRNRIINNHIHGQNSTNPIFGVMQEAVISGNVIDGKNGITLNNSANNLISDNQIVMRYGADSTNAAFREVGSCDANVITGMFAMKSRIFITGPNTHVQNSWNGTIWIADNWRNSGTNVNATATTWTILHDLPHNATMVSCSFNSTNIDSWKWTSTSTTITVTCVNRVTTDAIVACSWEAIYTS